jgi:hypothetical protein
LYGWDFHSECWFSGVEVPENFNVGFGKGESVRLVEKSGALGVVFLFERF